MKAKLTKTLQDIIRFVPDGERHTLPAGFRIAFYSPCDDLYVALPLGIHWVVRLWRRAWEWSLWYQPSRWERLARQMLDQQAQENCASCFANDIAYDLRFLPPEESKHEPSKERDDNHRVL